MKWFVIFSLMIISKKCSRFSVFEWFLLLYWTFFLVIFHKCVSNLIRIFSESWIIPFWRKKLDSRKLTHFNDIAEKISEYENLIIIRIVLTNKNNSIQKNRWVNSMQMFSFVELVPIFSFAWHVLRSVWMWKITPHFV